MLLNNPHHTNMVISIVPEYIYLGRVHSDITLLCKESQEAVDDDDADRLQQELSLCPFIHLPNRTGASRVNKYGIAPLSTAPPPSKEKGKKKNAIHTHPVSNIHDGHAAPLPLLISMKRAGGTYLGPLRPDTYTNNPFPSQTLLSRYPLGPPRRS